MPVCPSVPPHGTIRLQLVGFFMKIKVFCFIFRKSAEKIQFCENLTKITDALQEEMHIKGDISLISS
jgi:hypothetical protein